MEDQNDNLLEHIVSVQEALKEDDTESTVEKLEKLQKALEASEKNYSGPSPHLQIRDLSKIAERYLNIKAQNALAKKGTSIIVTYNEQIGDDEYIRKHAVCEYFSCQVSDDRIEEGVASLANTINALAEMGAIQSTLTGFSSLKLANMMFKRESTVVFCFVHIKPEFIETAKNMPYRTEEGGIGPTLHDLEVDLAPGEFLADGSVYPYMSVDQAKLRSKEVLIYHMINEYLKYLPNGTEFVGYRECSVFSLSLPVELKFKNPLLPNVTRVELDHVRSAAMVKEGDKEVLKQFNLFLGVRYYGTDPVTKQKGKRLFV